MGSQIPGSLEVQGRFPLDSKYWVDSKTNLNDGLVYDGLFRFTKDKQELYVRLSGLWTLFNVNKQYIKDEVYAGSPAGDISTQLVWLATNINSISKIVPRITISQAAAISMINNKTVIPGQPYKISVSTGFLLIDGGRDSSNFTSFGELYNPGTTETILVKADVRNGNYVEYSSGDGGGGPAIVVESSLASNSDENVPSVKAVNDGINNAIAALPGNGGGDPFDIEVLPEYICPADGTQTITLPNGADGVLDLIVLEITSGITRSLYPPFYSISNGVLTINDSIIKNDKISGYYYSKGSGGGGGGSSTLIARFSEYTVTSDGLQIITLPNGAKDILSVQVKETTGYVRNIYLGTCSVSNSMLTISVDANIKTGDKIIGNYYK